MVSFLFYGYILGYWGTGLYKGMYTGLYSGSSSNDYYRHQNITISDYLSNLTEGAILHHPDRLYRYETDVSFDQWLSPSIMSVDHRPFYPDPDPDSDENDQCTYSTTVDASLDPLMVDRLRWVAQIITEDVEDPMFILSDPEWHLIKRYCIVRHEVRGDVTTCETIESSVIWSPIFDPFVHKIEQLEFKS